MRILHLPKSLLKASAIFVAMFVLLFSQLGGRAFADFTCPTGMSQLDCNAIVDNWTDWVPNDAIACAASDSTPLVGNDNIQKAFNYFVQKGISGPGSAGIVGNLMVEDPGLVPDTVQGGGHAPAPIAGKGYGIAQWTSSGRQDNLVKLAQKENKKPSDLDLQLDYVWEELNTNYTSTLSQLKSGHIYDSSKSAAYNAAIIVLINYERAKDHSADGPNAIARGGDADQVIKLYGGGASTASANGSSSCGAVGAVNCSASGNSTATGGLSQVRQNVVCLAKNELATVWTPLPKTPRLEYYKYSDGIPQEWCADFTSWIYKQAGDPFTGGSSGGWRLAAVSEIMTLGQQNQKFHWHTSGYTPRPGDIVIHKNGESHVNIVVSVTGTTITMIGGDQGSGPYGGTNSASIVSSYSAHGFFSDGITGYVSPD